jgi:hypothetical protein
MGPRQIGAPDPGDGQTTARFDAITVNINECFSILTFLLP